LNPEPEQKPGASVQKQKKIRNNNQLRIFIEAAIEGSGLP